MPERQLLDIKACAAEIGDKGVARLRHDIERGLKPAVPGGRGRGRQARFDPEAVRRWRVERDAVEQRLDAIFAAACELPTVIAEAHEAVYREAGPNRHLHQFVLKRSALTCICYVRDHLAQVLPDLPDVEAEEE